MPDQQMPMSAKSREAMLKAFEESSEETIWTGRPHQVVNLATFVVCALLFWLVIPIGYAIWRFLVVRHTQYELTTERLRIRTGVFNLNIDDIELYRVRDYSIRKPLLLRLLKLADFHMVTSDRSHPQVTLQAIGEPLKVRELMRTNVERMRMLRRVRELDVDAFD